MLHRLMLSVITAFLALGSTAGLACGGHAMLVETGNGLRCILHQSSSADIVLWYFTGGYW